MLPHGGYFTVYMPQKYTKSSRPMTWDDLPPKERMVMAALYVCTQAEIAMVLKISQQAVSKIAKKARKN